jgi:hypothetical protein
MRAFVRALALIPRRFRRVKIRAKKTAQTANGRARKFWAALLHQITQMIGFMT